MASVWTPLLEGMSRSARAAWPFIQRAAGEGLNPEAIIEAMKAGGIPTFRRTDMLALIREASGAELVKSDLARWPVNVELPLARVRESVTKISAPFSYTLKVRVQDIETGAESFITRQAHSQQLRPFADVASAFMGFADQMEQYDNQILLSAEVVDVQRAGPAGVI